MGTTGEKESEEKKDEDEFVSDDSEVEGAEVDEGVTGPTKDSQQKIAQARKEKVAEEKKKFFANFQKNKVVPNITSTQMRPAGISKGLWKKELKRQIDPNAPLKKTRKGMRKPASQSQEKPELGKRAQSSTKTATLHKSNTSTFKS